MRADVPQLILSSFIASTTAPMMRDVVQFYIDWWPQKSPPSKTASGYNICGPGTAAPLPPAVQPHTQRVLHRARRLSAAAARIVSLVYVWPRGRLDARRHHHRSRPERRHEIADNVADDVKRVVSQPMSLHYLEIVDKSILIIICWCTHCIPIVANR